MAEQFSWRNTNCDFDSVTSAPSPPIGGRTGSPESDDCRHGILFEPPSTSRPTAHLTAFSRDLPVPGRERKEPNSGCPPTTPKRKESEMKVLSALLTLAVLATTAMAVPPVAWGPVHRHTEIMYTLSIPGYVQRKEWAYDFTERSLRVEATYLSGPKEYQDMNLTSWWINNTLTLLSYTGSVPTCNQLDLGFGLPVPNWFQFGSTTIGPGLYLTRQYSGSDGLYHRAVWTRKSAGAAGNFNYFSFNDTGAPFRMSAPSPPQGEVVNEYYNFKNVTGFPKGTFDIPAECSTSAPVHRLTKTDVAPVEATANLALNIAKKELQLPYHLAEVYASFVAQLVMMATAHW
jgi:hypothetical protein